MGLFGKKDEKVIYDEDASPLDLYEITQEEMDKLEEVVEELKKQVNEKYPDQIRKLSYEDGSKLISNLYSEFMRVAEHTFKFTYKVNQYKHIHTSHGKEVVIKPGKGIKSDYGLLAAFFKSIKYITKDIVAVLNEKFKEEKIDYSKINI